MTVPARTGNVHGTAIVTPARSINWRKGDFRTVNVLRPRHPGRPNSLKAPGKPGNEKNPGFEKKIFFDSDREDFSPVYFVDHLAHSNIKRKKPGDQSQSASKD